MSSIHNIILEDNEILVKKKLVKASPNYFKVGNGTMNKHKIQSINLLEEAMNASKAGQWLLKQITAGIGHLNDYSPVVEVKAVTAVDKVYLKKGFSELSDRDLVRRVKRGYYMINPNALIPTDYDLGLEIWENAKQKVPRPVPTVPPTP
jgi:hypothetical protein